MEQIFYNDNSAHLVMMKLTKEHVLNYVEMGELYGETFEETLTDKNDMKNHCGEFNIRNHSTRFLSAKKIYENARFKTPISLSLRHPI